MSSYSSLFLNFGLKSDKALSNLRVIAFLRQLCIKSSAFGLISFLQEASHQVILDLFIELLHLKPLFE